MWIEILKREVKARGATRVASELGVSKSTVSLVCNGKYPGGTGRIEERIKRIFGNNGHVACPVLGEITPARCAETHAKARSIGMKASSPVTLRLYRACRDCSVRREK